MSISRSKRYELNHGHLVACPSAHLLPYPPANLNTVRLTCTFLDHDVAARSKNTGKCGKKIREQMEVGAEAVTMPAAGMALGS